MTYQEIATHIRQLSVQERLNLLEVLTQSLKDELVPSVQRASVLKRIRGIGKPDGIASTDDEVAEDYTNYLLRKYS